MKRKTRLVIVAQVGVTFVPSLLSIPARVAQAADENDQKQGHKEKRKEFVRKNIIGRLRLYPPVPISGPYPHLLYTARVGDLVELQLSYPIAPPFPAVIRVSYAPPYFDVVDVVSTDNNVVVLQPGQSQTGMVGVGYYSIYLKATQEGQDTVIVYVDRDDGTTETVPFDFQVGAEAKTAWHGLFPSGSH